MAQLQIKNLCFLDRGPYNLDLAAGQVIAVSGESGSGKSLLLRAIADLEQHEGEVFLDGESYLEFSGPAWRGKVMYLPAESQWWHETVCEHFLYEPPAAELIEFGFSTEVLQWEISRLSSGEKQRLAILRMLLNQPEVMLLDEPTASLDPQNITRIEDLLKNYLQKNSAAAIWVSHDPLQIERVADQHVQILPGGGIRQVK